ncbi:MAG: CoA ester lyase [Bacillota bacterium]|nr:CoA ester lyase [Bacillota bacterium]
MHKFRKRRCELATPAVNLKMIEKALGLSVDQVFLDLEDSIPAERKGEARDNAISALNELDWGDITRSIRINDASSIWCYRDVVEIVSKAGANLDVIILPKVKGPGDLHFLDRLLTQLEKEFSLPGSIGIECLIESPEAVEYIREIAFSTPRLEALIFGAADFAASMGIPIMNLTELYEHKDKPAIHPWSYILNRIAVAGRAAGLQLIGGSFPGFREEVLENYRYEAEQEETFGFDGKWAIHPNQVQIAMNVFTPSEQVVDKARKLITAHKEALSRGSGAFVHDGEMSDAATVEVAERILARSGGLRF